MIWEIFYFNYIYTICLIGNNIVYATGFVGLNNVKANDYVNVIIQALAHIPPLRDFFILQNFETKSQLGIFYV